MAKKRSVDAETNAVLSDADEVELMIHSKGWEYAKSKIDARILDLQNINNLDDEKPETLSIQLAARKMAVDFMYGWLKEDIYGFVEQARANHIPPQTEDNGYIALD